MKSPILYAVAVVALAATPAFAAQQQKTTAPSQVKPKSQFIKDAARDDMAEVQLGKLAQSKAQSKEVKQLAQRLVTDHTNDEQQVRQLAQKESVQVPSSLSAEQKALEQHLQGLSGAAFDRAYVQAMVQDHQKAISAFEVATKSNDQNVQAYAQQTLPVLKDHLQMANQAERQVVGTSGQK